MFSNRKSTLTIVILALSMLATHSLAEELSNQQVVRYMDNKADINSHQTYYSSALKLALQKSANQYGPYTLKPIPVHMRQKRQFASLESGIIDVMWTGTSAEREKLALPIRIPLLKGMLGHRVFVIRKTEMSRYQKIDSLLGLSTLKAVQGLDWPDVDVLKHAGLKVENLVWRQSLYKLVSSGIVDYYPRSTIEVLDELRGVDEPDLIIEQKHLLAYPIAMYFFVRKQDEAVAARISAGLRMAIGDGSFDRNFLAFPSHKEALETFYNGERLVHQISNPFMSEATPLDDPTLWYKLPSSASTP